MIRAHARWRRIAIAVAIVVALQGIAFVGYRHVERDRTRAGTDRGGRALEPRSAPALVVERPDGSRDSLAALRGRVVIVHFWATWCPPCRDELPGLLALADTLRADHDVALLAVSVDDDWPTLRGFFDGAVPPAVVRLQTANGHLQYGASTLPDTYVVDRDGRFVARYAGAQDWRSPALQRDLRARVTR